MAQLPSYFHSIRLHLWHRWRLADATWKLDLVEAKLKQSMWGIIQNMDYTPFFSKSNNAIFQFICCFGFFRFLPKALVTCYFTIPAQNTLNPTKIVLKTNLFVCKKLGNFRTVWKHSTFTHIAGNYDVFGDVTALSLCHMVFFDDVMELTRACSFYFSSFSGADHRSTLKV